MKSTQISYIFLAVIGLLLYNVFLIQRDQKMFDAYYGKQTPHEKACAQLKVWHPDCKVE